MDQPSDNQHGSDLALSKRDEILVAITEAAELFLRGSLETWQDNVLQVIARLGKRLKVKRIFLLKHVDVTAEQVITGLRYEWIAEGDQTAVDVPGLQDIHFQEAGFGRWAGLLYEGGIIRANYDELPDWERGWFLSQKFQTLTVVPVYVEQQWWGFIGFEDYSCDQECSVAELDAFKTIAVTFGAAIRRKRMGESLQAEKAEVMQKAKEVQDIARFPAEDPSPVLRVSASGEVLYLNRAAQPLAQQWQTQVHGRVPDEWNEAVGRVLNNQQSESVDLELMGRVHAVLLVPIVESSYVNLYARDVTQERELSRMKTEFISMASHQLRTPLTSMRWYSESLLKKDEGLSPDQIKKAQVIHDTSVQLANLIDDLLSLSRMERGKIEPEPAMNNIQVLVDEVVMEMAGQAEEKRINLSHQRIDELEPCMFDADLMRQVILNFVSNALKYTPEEGVVSVKTRVNGQGNAQVEVVDTGIGIGETEKDKVFSRFFRSRSAVDAGIEGTGLGLSVAKMMVEKSGGEVWFESQEGKGSTFGFSLPMINSQ